MSTSPQAGFLCVLLLSMVSGSLLCRPSTVQPIARLQSSLLSASRTDMAAAPLKKVKDLALVFCRRTLWNSPDEGCKEVLLGLKKRGFGEGKWNGFGGKVETGETVEEAAKRELLEESGVTAQKLSLRGQLIFNVPSYPSTMRVFVYEAVLYGGDPAESDEMRPQWFKESDLPLKEMWADDAHWMPLFLAGKFFKGEFDFSDEQTIVDYRLWNLPSSETIQR